MSDETDGTVVPLSERVHQLTMRLARLERHRDRTDQMLREHDAVLDAGTVNDTQQLSREVAVQAGTDKALKDRINKLEHAVADHERHIARGLIGHPPLAVLRANGVTRYKRGDLEIELGTAPLAHPDAPGLAAWLPEPDRRARPGPAVEQTETAPVCTVDSCPTRQVPLWLVPPNPGAFEQLVRAIREGSQTGPAAAQTQEPPEEQGKPSADLAADDKPPVEIDMEETRRLLEEQHARRRGEG
jgi:hypothetical protein